MKLQIIGCSHHSASVDVRERIAFSPDQTRDALQQFQSRFPGSEAVLLSTCNRVEFYTAAEESHICPSHQDVVAFLAEYHGIDQSQLFDDLFERTGEDAIRHLFTVAASLDSMVVGEAQILSQVKQAYEMARLGNSTGVLTNQAFQAAIRVAKRVATETAINQKRVSIPSVAVGDYAHEFFETFDDKRVLVIGAGEMGEETLRYLMDLGTQDITIINRSMERAENLAARTGGRAVAWDQLDELLLAADMVISTTGATEPIVTVESFRPIARRRAERLLFILDLAVPRDFEPGVGDYSDVYLYSVDDLAKACEKNKRARAKEWPKAERLIEDETSRFMAELLHRSTGPTIRRLRQQAASIKEDELTRLLNKLNSVSDVDKAAISKAFDRVVNKLLHPPLESLRDEVEQGNHE
ncbi:MAG TPA: glutamyl-tRNA reductase, partial [Planctomycetaceae bacterium]|nr:glutamyl-tRNA reductase [Planctomycetaceae bacterium]